MSFGPIKAVSWLRRLVILLLPPRPEIDSRSFRMWFLRNKVTLGQALTRVLLFLPLCVILTMFHTHPYLQVTLTRRAIRRSLRNFQIRWSLSV